MRSLVCSTLLLGLLSRCGRFPRHALAVLALTGACCLPAQAQSTRSILWGVMSWRNYDQANQQPNPTTDTTNPLFMQGNGRIITHMFQNPHAQWLAARTSASNITEIQRVYNAGYAIQLLLYFQNCNYDPNTGVFDYPLNDQFLSDFQQIINAYKNGGGPLYIAVFPEFELWFGSKSEDIKEAYRAKIRSQFAQMTTIAGTYKKAYIGLCFQSRYLDDYGSFGTAWKERWGPVLEISDLVFINPHDGWTNWDVQQREIIQGSKGFWDNWGLPLAIPFGDLWGGGNSQNINPPLGEKPWIFSVGGNNAQEAATYDTAIANWISRTWTASSEGAPDGSGVWKTNLETLKSRGLFMWSMFEDSYIRPSLTAPNGQTYTMSHFTTMKNNWLLGKSYLYPITEMEYWPAALPDRVPTRNPTTLTYTKTADANCSSGYFGLLNSNAQNQNVTFKVWVGHPATYNVRVGYRMSPNYGTFQLAIGGTAQGGYVDSYSATPVRAEVNLGNRVFSERGVKDFKFTVMTRNSASSGFNLGLDYIKLIPQ